MNSPIDSTNRKVFYKRYLRLGYELGLLDKETENEWYFGQAYLDNPPSDYKLPEMVQQLLRCNTMTELLEALESHGYALNDQMLGSLLLLNFSEFQFDEPRELASAYVQALEIADDYDLKVSGPLIEESQEEFLQILNGEGAGVFDTFVDEFYIATNLEFLCLIDPQFQDNLIAMSEAAEVESDESLREWNLEIQRKQDVYVHLGSASDTVH